MDYKICIYNEMGNLIRQNEAICTDLKSILLSFIEAKSNSAMIFGNLCILHYKEYTNNFNTDIYKVAAAVELLILSYDIFDDLQDNDTHNIWNNTPSLSMNSALSLIFIISDIIINTNFENKILAKKTFEKYALKSINGQHLDLTNNCCDEKSYLNMVSLKSGSLTTLSCLIGTVLAQKEADDCTLAYSNMIGIIQQLKNDLYDLQTDSFKNDLFNKKFSLPIIFLMSSKSLITQNVISYYNGHSNYINIQSVVNELNTIGAFQYALAIQHLYKYNVEEQLDALKISNELKEYITYLMK